MSSTNYDVELNISYNNSYRHYIPSYEVHFPYYKRYEGASGYTYYWYYGYVSLDDESEKEFKWLDSRYVTENQYFAMDNTGIFSKVYFRNPERNAVIC